MSLTERDRMILQFEESWWTGPGAKAALIRSELGVSPSHYYAALARLVDSPEALAHSPLLVRRLQRKRRARRRDRFEGAVQPSRPRR